MAGSGSASASIPLLVSRSVSGALSSRRFDSKSTTSSGSVNEDADIDIDIEGERVKTVIRPVIIIAVDDKNKVSK